MLAYCSFYTMMLKLLQWMCIVALCARLVLGQDCISCECCSCCLQVTENSPPGTSVGFATANTALQMEFEISNGAEFNQLTNDNFVIEASSGEILVAENATLDAETDNLIQFSVEFSGVSPQFFGIIILDENDEAPVFRATSPLRISIPETTSDSPGINCASLRSTLNMLIATDGDIDAENSKIFYSISNSSIFSIPDPSITPPCISNGNVELDRDRSDYEDYVFTLTASNDENVVSLNSSITVILALTGVNEFPPSLPDINEMNELNVLENRSIGYEIYQFAAVDNDRFDEPQVFDYKITSGIGINCPFLINNISGSLTLKSEIDAESTTGSCPLSIEVSDRLGESGSINIVVSIRDVNEPAMIMNAFGLELNITENKITESFVAIFSVMDGDSEFNNNTVELISGSDCFRVISSSPTVYRIKQIKSLDRENFTRKTITIRLIEHGEPTFSHQGLNFTINVLDENDNKPFLNISSMEIEEEQGFDIKMLGRYVKDLDEGANATVREIELISAAGSIDITARFIKKNNNSPFLGPGGTLHVPIIDREVDGDVITIRVNITDNGTPPLSGISTFTLTITDINDNMPQFQFEEYTFDIPENTPPRLVGVVIATDRDEGENRAVTYSLDSDFFEIISMPDSENGNVIGEIRSLIEFDRENTVAGKHMLTVNAGDNRQETVSVTVIINILDEDDNPPMFVDPNEETFNVALNSAIGTHVGTILANDLDSGANAEIIYSLTDTTSVSINSTTGVITLQEVPIDETTYNLTVTISPRIGNETSTSKQIIIVISQIALSELYIITAGIVSPLVIIIMLVLFIVLACYCAQKKKRTYNMKNGKREELNNQPERMNSFAKPILKSVPAAAATNGSIGNRERVQVKFSDLVDEAHYDRQGTVLGDKVLRKASITNFGSSDESPIVPSRGSPIHNGVSLAGTIPVMDYEQSPGQLMNGITNDYTGLQRYEMHQIAHHSPLHLRREMNDHTDFSQGTVSSYNSDGEEESTFSDGASNMNTSIPCFKDEHRYGPPPSHPPHYLPVHHSPHMPSPNGLLGVIHPGNMSSLAAEGSYRSSQGNGYPNRHSQNHHSLSDSSSQSTTPSPHPRHEILNRMEPPSMRAKHPLTNGHSYPRPPPPLVMPDAYPIGGLPDMHRREVISRDLSLSDFGEASTYASTELDEALNINYEPEPGFYSLTATDYDDHDN